MRKKILEAFRSTAKTGRNAQDILIGGTLLFFPIIQFISIGFLLKKLDLILRLEKTSPRWDENLKELLIWGVMGAGVALVYLAIPFLLMLLSGFFVSTLSGGKILSLFFVRGQVINLVMILFFIFTTFLLPMAIPIMLESKNLRRAFNIPLILDRIFLIPRDYVITYATILSLYIASLAIIFLITQLVIGLILAGFLLFYDGYASIHLIGKVFPRQSVTVPVKTTEPDLFYSSGPTPKT
ncbi:MAG TPA: DUF4013 domain-containing protein [bacterium]|nr:DUF4013 domain-containing protein [bacterium]HOL67084.1 DUF4013 domain-containing protein [bacterium]HPP11862.1 DUF4013 domain-containing protein [bacterium]